ncbi:MAG: aminoglycoside phosphotransferase family protein [Opitutus sp.]
MISPSIELASVARQFQVPGEFLSAAPYGTGHINDTYVAHFGAAGTTQRYILQRINRRIFQNVPALMDNVRRVTAHTGRSAGRTLTIVPNREGQAFVVDAASEYWRCYVFIEGARSYDQVENERHAYEAARAFGAFQCLLTDLPGPRLHETIPRFHDTRKRFEDFRSILAADPLGRASAIQPDIEFALARESLVDRLLQLQQSGEIPERITHNDTKFSNVMLDDVTGEAVCVIDLDTVMPGLALYDFGDMVRSASNSAAEDERDVSKITMRLSTFESLARGYISSAGAFLNAAERAHMAFAAKLITFENGLRFLGDHLAGDVYYKIKRENHNLDRGRNQFALVRSMEQQEGAMQRTVEGLFST